MLNGFPRRALREFLGLWVPRRSPQRSLTVAVYPFPNFSPQMKLCEICGTKHESYQAHVFASNKVIASNHASNRPSNATNGDVGGAITTSAGSSSASLDRDPVVGSGGGEDGGRKQRWSRESYNAYQREYMRKRRAA